jgi:hypothetical protein
MVPARFTAKTLPRRAQLEGWCAWHDSIFYVIRSPEPADRGFPATHLYWKLGSLGISCAVAPTLYTEGRRLSSGEMKSSVGPNLGRRHCSGDRMPCQEGLPLL